MRTLIYVLPLLGAMLASMLTNAAEGDSTKVEKKIVKTITITDGKTVVIDSVLTFEGDNIIVEVDTFKGCVPFGMGPHHIKMMKTRGKGNWTALEDKEIEMMVETDGDSTQVLVFETPHGKVKKIIMDGEELPMHKRMMKFRYGEDEDFEWVPGPKHKMFFYGDQDISIPDVPMPPSAPGFRNNAKNLIDLNDPDIISFEKKEQKDGTEKITIIRKKKE
ncbi:MAG: hypothetical protein JW798_17290 [Prolixibacteraceae bacterium]|nr:hypothetical protein [Prolixibacteraceae bacterium]